MPNLDISPDDIRRLTELMEQSGLSELRYEEGNLRITLRTAAFYRTAPVVAAPTLPPSEITAVELTEMTTEFEAVTVPVSDVPLMTIEAPLMGVFYRTPAQDAPPFIEVGDTVEVGQVIGLIEAMKVFSEVLSEVSGQVQELPVKSGTLVQPGDVLVRLSSE